MKRSSARNRHWTRILPCGILALLISFLVSAARAEEKSAIDWQPWSDKIFERAAAEHKFVLLDLGAGWCHWCHVMDELTYSDPKVIELLRAKYIAVRVDQDARPDLSNRYEDYGWPATVVFNAERGEIVKRQGYIPPKPMASLLQAIIDDPTPGPSVEPEPVVIPAADSALTKEQRAAMRAAFLGAYDSGLGGWGEVHK
jgi:thiol:disulfide interchange protein